MPSENQGHYLENNLLFIVSQSKYNYTRKRGYVSYLLSENLHKIVKGNLFNFH